MSINELANTFYRMVDTISSSNDLNRCWRDILEITGEQGNMALASAEIKSDLDSIVAQVKKTLHTQPPSSEIRLLWFGLFDGRRGGKDFAGYYLAGWTSKEQLDGGGPPPYFPESRYFTSQLLDTIKNEALRIGTDSPKYSVLVYAVMFGAAATLSRFATRSLGITLPIYVGFDSGDFAKIAN
jgi:hypothetical protein